MKLCTCAQTEFPFAFTPKRRMTGAPVSSFSSIFKQKIIELLWVKSGKLTLHAARIVGFIRVVVTVNLHEFDHVFSIIHVRTGWATNLVLSRQVFALQEFPVFEIFLFCCLSSYACFSHCALTSFLRLFATFLQGVLSCTTTPSAAAGPRDDDCWP